MAGVDQPVLNFDYLQCSLNKYILNQQELRKYSEDVPRKLNSDTLSSSPGCGFILMTRAPESRACSASQTGV